MEVSTGPAGEAVEQTAELSTLKSSRTGFIHQPAILEKAPNLPMALLAIEEEQKYNSGRVSGTLSTR